MKNLSLISRILIALSAVLMVSAYFVPLWQILMWAPQYPEGLEMKIWINTLSGDVKIISALNHYIGMKHIEVSMFPEFTYMIYIVGALIVAGLLTSLINKRFMLLIYAGLIIACGIAALVDFYLWGYDYGHNLDPTAPIVVPGMSYQPPLIGTKQLLNFTAFSGPDIGGWIFVVAGILAIGTLVFEVYKSRKTNNTAVAAIVLFLMLMSSCSTAPEQLHYREDACHTCKMTLMDTKFGAEIVTQKGKVYKFDDANCTIQFLNKQEIKEGDIKHLLIVDFSTPEKLIDATHAFYIKSEKIKSPMASNVAAFENKNSADLFNKEWTGIPLTWGELLTQYK